MHRLSYIIFTIVLIYCASVHSVAAQTTAFSYQGSLNNSGTPANGNFDFEFALFDTLGGVNQIGTTQTRSNVVVTNGAFSVTLDFGNQFPGLNRFLEIRVRPAGGGAFTPLTPRQQVNSAPYSIKSVAAESAVTALNATNAANALTATNATQLGGVAASQYVVTTDSRLTDARAPTAGSTSYVQNQNAAPQPSTNFNISGAGTVGGTLTANIVSAALAYRIGATTVFATPGTNNLSVGPFSGPSSAGTGSGNVYVGFSTGSPGLSSGSSNSLFGAFTNPANTAGSNNSIFGFRAGFQNTTSNNSFFGFESGEQNSSGADNAFFGRSAGNNNSTASNNSFFGSLSGEFNTIGTSNAFFGFSTGQNNIDGDNNSFYGVSAGLVNSSGNGNSFFGRLAGRNTSTGSSNTIVGLDAGLTNTIGSSNTVVGANADVGANNLTFATAIGAGAVVSTSNTVQIGRGSDTVNLPGKLKLNILGSAGATGLCRNGSAEIATCSSSARYKSNIASFSTGLDLVRKLRPVSFNWREGGMRDLGLVAEDVAKVEPLLTTTNDKGQVEGVKYDRVGVVLVNAVKEQQAEIDVLRKTNAEQDARLRKQAAEIDALKKIVCATNSKAEICRPQPKQ